MHAVQNYLRQHELRDHKIRKDTTTLTQWRTDTTCSDADGSAVETEQKTKRCDTTSSYKWTNNNHQHLKTTGWSHIRQYTHTAGHSMAGGGMSLEAWHASGDLDGGTTVPPNRPQEISPKPFDPKIARPGAVVTAEHPDHARKSTSTLQTMPGYTRDRRGRSAARITNRNLEPAAWGGVGWCPRRCPPRCPFSA